MHTQPGRVLVARLLGASLLSSAAFAQSPAGPQTVPESSNYERTSAAADVEHFVDACVKLPHGDRLTVSIAGKTSAGRAQLLVKVANPDTPTKPRLRALVIGNIHAGEVEGKEALQELLREFANGEHEDVLQRCDVWLLPIYNVDGNEAFDTKNRPGQNGPDLVGKRANGMGLDLNRDFVKAEAPETKTLLRLFREVDPHLFVDLHTTDGSYHGYHLTYSPSLSTNVDRDVARLSRTLLDQSTAALAKDGFQIFDYGNFETRDWDGGGAPESSTGERGWWTYDYRARYGTNYFALRNRISVLSEAYAYADFKTRIAVTRAFVLSLLHGIVQDEDELRRVTEAADARVITGQDPVWFGCDTGFAPLEKLPVLVSDADKLERGDDKPLRFVRKDESKPEVMNVARAFRSRQQRRLPTAWLIPQPSPEVVGMLRLHGIEFAAIEKPRQEHVERFAVTAKRKPKPPFQGHQELVLKGEWQPAADVELTMGTIVVPAHQRLAHLAATLLEPESEDSLSSWNFFEKQTGDFYPVLRQVPAAQ